MVSSYQELQTEASAQALVRRLMKHLGFSLRRQGPLKIPSIHQSTADTCQMPCDLHQRLLDYYEPHNRALYASEPEFPPFELGCCDATADTTVHLLPCLTSFQGGADKKGSPKRCEMVAAGTAAG